MFVNFISHLNTQGEDALFLGILQRGPGLLRSLKRLAQLNHVLFQLEMSSADSHTNMAHYLMIGGQIREAQYLRNLSFFLLFFFETEFLCVS